MKGIFHINNQKMEADFSQPLDISIPIDESIQGPNCFYAPFFETEPVRAGDFVGSTRAGGLVNFLNIRLNPHGNGTHTECVGHIAKEVFTINQSLTTFLFTAQLITIIPTLLENGDRLLTLETVKEALAGKTGEAVVIRTTPNELDKRSRNYSGSNPTYVAPEAIQFIVDHGFKHLLIDLPSVDREEDGGRLAAHKAFWNYPENPQADRTITELIFVSNLIQDGLYLLNLQIAAFEIDVSPSKPILYHLKKID